MKGGKRKKDMQVLKMTKTDMKMNKKKFFKSDCDTKI